MPATSRFSRHLSIAWTSPRVSATSSARWACASPTRAVSARSSPLLPIKPRLSSKAMPQCCSPCSWRCRALIRSIVCVPRVLCASASSRLLRRLRSFSRSLRAWHARASTARIPSLPPRRYSSVPTSRSIATSRACSRPSSRARASTACFPSRTPRPAPSTPCTTS